MKFSLFNDSNWWFRAQWRLFSVLRLRVGDVLRAGANLVTIATFMMSPTLFLSPDNTRSFSVLGCTWFVLLEICRGVLVLYLEQQQQQHKNPLLPKFCLFPHWEVSSVRSSSAAALKFLTYTPALPCSSFQVEPRSVRPECIRFSIGNVVLKILAWLKVYTDRSLDSPPCDDSLTHRVTQYSAGWLNCDYSATTPYITHCQCLCLLKSSVWVSVRSCPRKMEALCNYRLTACHPSLQFSYPP